jgi:Type I phosphodiesterase / nucleotide pyrophosphatase
MTAAGRGDLSVLFLELNEAEKYWIDRLVSQDKLPVFRRLLTDGVCLRTFIPEFDTNADRAWRTITPWIIWPSVYTGMTPSEHGIVAFGQDTTPLQGRCVWDVLDRAGVSTGVFGSLLSFPPRNAGNARYYVPESLADDAECFPAEARPVQDFCVFTSRNYSEDFASQAVHATRLLIRSMRSGVRAATVARTLLQIPREIVGGDAKVPERAMLQSYVLTDAFKRLYATYKPRFATLHLNNVAYMQHRYWRAAEPDRYRDELSLTDQRFFDTVAQRRAYEKSFAAWIERSLIWTDGLLGELLELVDDDTVLLVGTALGQKPHDPVNEIHNPVVRLVKEDELFAALGFPGVKVLTQMNPDVSISLPDEATAARAAELVKGLYVHPGHALFEVERKGRQVFLELIMPRRPKGEILPAIRHATVPGFELPFERHVQEHPTNDQSTAQHDEPGFLLAHCRGRRLERVRPAIPVTDIAPTILSWFGLGPQPWMTGAGSPAIVVH